MAEANQVWVKTSILESILNPNATPNTKRLGMHGSLCELCLFCVHTLTLTSSIDQKGLTYYYTPRCN